MNYQILILFIINSFNSMGYSLIAPLFPIIGENIHISESLLGWIIAVNSLANFSITPFAPQLIQKIGRFKIFYISSFIYSFSVISYGLFKYITNFTFFIFISFSIRILHGMATGIISTVIYSLGVSLSKPEELTTSLGYLEVAWSLGVSIGPVCASFLYHFGGYSLPFYTIGILFFIPIYLIKYLNNNKNTDEKNYNNLNDSLSDDSNNKEEKNENLNFFAFFNFEMFMNFLPTVVFQIAQTYYFPSLTYHLTNKWHLSIECSSLFFMIGMAAYFIGLQILNKILNNFGLTLTILLGQIVIIFGAPFVYPLKFLPQNIISIIFGLALLGISGAFTCVAVIIIYGKIAKKINSELNENSINDISSAVFNLGINFGDFLGPVYGGFISTKYDFSYSNIYMSFIALCNFILFFIYYYQDIIFVFKDIFYNGFNKERFNKEDKEKSQRNDIRLSRSRKYSDNSFQSFDVIDKTSFINK